MVSDKLVKELKVIIKEEFGVELTDERTASLSNFLVDYFRILLEMNKDKPKG